MGEIKGQHTHCSIFMGDSYRVTLSLPIPLDLVGTLLLKNSAAPEIGNYNSFTCYAVSASLCEGLPSPVHVAP